MYRKIWQIFVNFGQNMAIENLKENLILALLIFNIALWLYNQEKKRKKKGGLTCTLLKNLTQNK